MRLTWQKRTCNAARAFVLLMMTMAATAAWAQPADPYQRWESVLTRFVNERGEIDFHALARERADLDAFLESIARASPRSHPDLFASRESQIAYYINAYNALAMFNVIDTGIPMRLSGPLKVKFFGFRKFTVGGERLTLYALENDVIRPLGDARVHFALNCMAAGCPRLPRKAFRAETLDAQLDAEARHFFGERRNLYVDLERQTVNVSELLKFYAEDFLARAPTLNAYINLYAQARVPDHYGVVFIDYDWTVNSEQRSRGAESGR